VANNPSYPSSPKQPQPRILGNPPTSSLPQALAQNKQQVDKSKQ
jgi:hypothetical protein